MTDSGSSRERRKKEKYELPTPYLLFSIKLIFFKWLLQVSLGGNIYSYHNAAYTQRSDRRREREKREATSVKLKK